jgi:integrase
MHDALHEFLLELPAPDNGRAFLFPSLAGKSTGGKSGLSMAFKRTMERAKVRGEVARERTGEKGRSVNTLTFHSFRHTLTSIMANAGAVYRGLGGNSLGVTLVTTGEPVARK